MNAAMQRNVLIALAAAGLGASAGYWLAAGRSAPTAATAATAVAPAAVQGERRVLYWYDPMAPAQHFDKPGKSPFMDMALLPKYADEGGDAAAVTIDPGVSQNLAIRLAKVERGRLEQAVEAAANVVFNDRDVAVVQARSGGFVERVYGRAPGDVVARGAPLADLLMPDWAAAQSEYLALQKSGDAELAAAAKNRLRLAGMPAELIEQVDGSGQVHAVVTVAAPIGGVIQTLDVRAGMNVAAGAALAKITGLATVWLEAAVPEAQGALVAIGRPIEARFAAFPGETVRGRVISVLPENSAESRTLRVRAELPNPAGRLRPGMFAQVRLSSGEAQAALLVPSEAVIRTGRRNVVIVAGEGGRFQPVEVEVGRDVDGRTAILKGLEEGQKVVASGQFLIDSEASLKGVLARFGDGSGAAPAVRHEASGKVEAVGQGEITLSHGPVESLGWGAMTMAFKLARPDLAASLKPGDAVHFWFRQADDKFIVEKIDKRGAAQ